MRQLAFLLIVFGSSLLWAQPKVRIAVGEWPPYHGEALPDQGIYTKMIVDLLKETGYEVEVSFFPWKRAYHLVEMGEYDITGFWFFNSDRCEIFRCTNPVVSLTNNIFVRDELDRVIDTWEDLKSLRIGLTIGYSYPDLFAAAERENLDLHHTRSDLLNMRKLLVGHIDAFVCNRDVGIYLIENHFTVAESRKLSVLDSPQERLQMGLLISRRARYSGDLLNNINATIQKWRETNRFRDFQSPALLP